MMQSLDKDLRSALEKTVKAARAVAETAANAAVDQLGVGQDKPEAFLSDSEKALRNRLRTHGKQLGDARDSKSTNPTYGKQEVQHLMQEVAYEHWHRMLFARFLADNNLLMYDGVAVTIEECEELAPDEGAKSGWELAGKLAARMLPQVFKPGSPVFELTFAPEHQSELEQLLKALPEAVFKASDSLGWVYQFWQADNKERINKSEVKIGADELPAVTQLFTEPYMVAFLLQNSLGAWWSTRHPGKPCPVNLDYFRTLEDGTPAAGNFEGWPDSLADFKMLDPCCGSGHFLVASFLMLVPIRMAAEGLSAKDAVNRVLAENIHGLEIDPRCVEIAVFAVAFEAWRYPDASGKPLGVREIPVPNIACCGLKVAAKVQDWEALVPDNASNAVYLREGLARLHKAFTQAPLLGSLLNPAKAGKGDLFGADYRELGTWLTQALSRETAATTDNQQGLWESALSAQGLVASAQLLDASYHLITTNVPYVGQLKYTDELKEYILEYWPHGKSDLALAFTLRCQELLFKGGFSALVLPQGWLTQTQDENFRRDVLGLHAIRLASNLGRNAFTSSIGQQVMLLMLESTTLNGAEVCTSIDSTNGQGPLEKAAQLINSPVLKIKQNSFLQARKAQILLSSEASNLSTLGEYADCLQGLSTGEKNRFERLFWEVTALNGVWDFLHETAESSGLFGGMQAVIFWEQENGHLAALAEQLKHLNHAVQSWRRGKPYWGRPGIAINRMGSLNRVLYLGDKFSADIGVISPKHPEYLLPIVAFVLSEDFLPLVRSVYQKPEVPPSYLVNIPFNYLHWKRIAEESYPDGLPKPFSENPTQWLFHGHPQRSSEPLQVAVARLVGYSWPAEVDDRMELSDEARRWVARSKALSSHSDNDGIVCIPPVGRESPASDRLLNMLAAAYGETWSTDVLAQLLTAADHAGKSLESWLREKFFAQHCALFGNRPFVWHIWDGLRDGFAALVNYHKLDYKTLETLIYTYLGDWIGRQKRDSDNHVDGAQEKLAAAEALKKRLELILVGEAPYDIFVRWKPIEKQPVGWNPDLNDGVRLNIRPFLSVPDVGKRGAGVLREKPKSLHWEKDRGSDVASASWYKLGLQYDGKAGDRINDHHLTLAEKRAAREKAK